MCLLKFITYYTRSGNLRLLRIETIHPCVHSLLTTILTSRVSKHLEISLFRRRILARSP